MRKMMNLALVLQLFIVIKGSVASCPANFDYVHQIPWNSSFCQSGDHKEQCRQTLLSLLSIALAQLLKDFSMFQFPNYSSATACLSEFEHQLSSMAKTPLSPTLLSSCLNDTSMFVSSPSLCDGIQTKQDWIDLLGTTAIDSACKGDLSDIAACDLCVHAAEQVSSRLVGMDKNLTDSADLTDHSVGYLCFDFAVLYAAMVNEFGPKSIKTASCTFRLPISLAKTKDKRRLVLISTSVGAAVIVASLSAFVGICLLRTRRKRDAAHRQFLRRNREVLRAIVGHNTGTVWFSIEDIKVATNNFSPANLIGQGSFGTVYRGTLPDRQLVAVKRIRNCSAEGDPGFLNEVEIINNIRHRNLVPLKGCCLASDDEAGHQRFLIYDYMPNGSLDEHLFGGNLSWPQRKNIVLGTAKGLAYLHRGVVPAIYHRDIKPTNILLDDHMNARVSDFGLARMMTQEAESHLTTRVAGTHGFLAPEYALYGQLTDKSDVYSFGVVMLEIMSGRKALDTSLESTSDYLISDWAWKLEKAGKAIEVIDDSIRHSGPMNIMARFVSVGILCSHIMVAYRPTIAQALKMLEGDAEIPEIPDRPLPMTYRSLSFGENGT